MNYPAEYNLLNMMLDENPSKRPTTLGIKVSQQIVESQHSDLHAGDYQLIGVDLRQLHEFSSKIRIADLDVSQPTLFITECVLIYMDEEQSDDLLREIDENIYYRFFY